jgi:hypothetical protein
MTTTTYSEAFTISKIQPVDKLIFIAVSIIMAAFLVARAILVPMAHDEIATFYYFVQSGKVSPFLSNIDTNNHFLNSALTWVSYRFFGSSPLALRLPNLLFIPGFSDLYSLLPWHLRCTLLNSWLFRGDMECQWLC